MNEVQEIERKECCVCDGKEKDGLRSTAKGIVTLAGQFVEFWKNGLLPFDPGRITIMLQEKLGLNILISSVPCSTNQQNIIITVTFDIHHITWQGRKNRYEVRTRKLKWGNLVPFYVHLWAQILVDLQVQQFQILFALYAVNTTPLRTFMLMRHFMRLNRN